MLDKIIAIVGNHTVLISDIERQYLQMIEQGAPNEENSKCQILQQILLEKLLVHQAAIDSVMVSDEEVDKELNNRMKYYISVFGSEEKFEDYYKKSISEFKADFRDDMKDLLTSQKMQQQIIAGVKVTPQDVKDFFNSLPKDSIPYFNAEVELERLTLIPEVSEAENLRSIKLLQDIKAKIISGEKTFDEMARAFSEDPGSGQNGGFLGWTNRGEFVGSFEAAAYSMGKDEISGIVKSEFGFHLIKLLERRGNRINTQHILIKPKLNTEDIRRKEALIDSLRLLILEGQLSFNEAVEKYSDSEAEKKNGGIMLNQYSGNSLYETSQLEPDIYFAIDKLATGDISKPVLLTDQSGAKTINIFRIISKTRPHIANLEDDFNKLSQATQNIRQEETLQKWVENHIRKTYIRLDEDYLKKCPALSQWVIIAMNLKKK